MNILTLNAGSSSLKYKLFRMIDGAEDTLLDGVAERVEGGATERAAEEAIDRCRYFGIDAVGHRVVHGGPLFAEPTLVTDEMLTQLRGLAELDPLHNETEVAMIEAARKLLPGVAEVAVFDTAFHQTLPPVAYQYALPWELAERTYLRRYGFHGISHRYVSETLIQKLGRGAAGTRLITCHLGNGASLCAVKDGKSIDTSMGMTPLEGLIMGTRSGDIDPGLLMHLLRTQIATPDKLDELVNHRSGLLGLSRRSADVREIEKGAADGDEYCELALDMFAYRACKYVGAYATVLAGVDAIAFTGGIGQHSAQTRARICARLGFLGLDLDPDLNTHAGGEIARVSTSDARAQIWVVPTDEERQIARETVLKIRS
jgi:acetate kinase